MELLPIKDLTYDQKKEVIGILLDEVAQGNPLNKVCEKSGYVFSSVYFAITENEEFSKMYARAKEIRAHVLAEEILSIADDSSGDYTVNDKGEEVADHENIQRSRLRVDTRKWIASKMLPKTYGEKVDVTTDGEKINVPVITWTKSE